MGWVRDELGENDKGMGSAALEAHVLWCGAVVLDPVPRRDFNNQACTPCSSWDGLDTNGLDQVSSSSDDYKEQSRLSVSLALKRMEGVAMSMPAAFLGRECNSVNCMKQQLQHPTAPVSSQLAPSIEERRPTDTT